MPEQKISKLLENLFSEVGVDTSLAKKVLENHPGEFRRFGVSRAESGKFAAKGYLGEDVGIYDDEEKAKKRVAQEITKLINRLQSGSRHSPPTSAKSESSDSLLGVLERLASVIGKSVAVSKAAKQAAEQTQSTVSERLGKGNLASTGGKVIAGTPPGTENARSMTAMLGGFKKPPKPPGVQTGGMPPDDDDDDEKPRRRKRRRKKRREYSSDDSRERSVSSAATRVKEYSPTAPPRAGQYSKEKGGFLNAAKNIGRELLGLRGSSTNPIVAEEVGIKKARAIAEPPSLPGIRGKIGRVGGWVHKIGAAKGGRLGGALMEAGGTAARFGGVTVGATTSGAATGGVATSGAAVGGAAAGGGGMLAAGAAALSNPVTAAVAAIVGVGVAVVGVTKLFHSLSESITEGNRAMRRYSGTINTAFARLDRQKIKLDVRTAQGTRTTTMAAAQSTMQMREALQPLEEDWQNMKNVMSIGMSGIVTLVANIVETAKSFDPVIQPLLDWLGEEDKKKKEEPLPFEAAMRAMGGYDKGPSNKKPGE